jgi:hypothetical protein
MLTEGLNGTAAEPVRNGFFSWFIPEGIFSGPGLIGTPLLVLGVAYLLPALLAAIARTRVESPWAAWIIGFGGSLGGTLLIRRGYLSSQFAEEGPSARVPLRHCWGCGKELQGMVPHVEIAFSELSLGMDERRGVECVECGQSYCLACMEHEFVRDGFARPHCRACDAKFFESMPGPDEENPPVSTLIN